jgi:GNAT superfamily N-acetyltransferase
MNDVVIRRAHRSDRALVLLFHRALYVKHREAILPSDVAEFYAYRDLEGALRDDVDALLHSPRAFVMIAERNGEPVGYATGHIEEDDERRLLRRKGVVEDWYVDEAARGAGVGALLVEALAAAFRDASCQVIESTTWPFNDGARRAHEALGFHEVEVKYRKRL